jgi:hypothetical protein
MIKFTLIMKSVAKQKILRARLQQIRQAHDSLAKTSTMPSSLPSKPVSKKTCLDIDFVEA